MKTHQQQVAEYIGEIAAELGKAAREAGLLTMAHLLEMTALETAAVIGRRPDSAISQ